MWVSTMDLLVITAAGLTVVFTIMGIKTYLDDRSSWRELALRADNYRLSESSE